MKPSTPRGLPAPRSNAAVRSRNTQQYTQRLSIQNEGGFRFTGRCRRMRESSFLWTCHWGGCSKMVLTFRGYVSGLSAARAKAFLHCGDQALGVENGFVFEHEVNGASQFDGQNRVGFEFVAVDLRLQALRQRADQVVIAFGDDRGFTKGPAQVGIAQLGSAQALDLAGAGDGAFDQPTIAQEIFDGGEAAEVADLIENGQAQALADAGHGLKQSIVATGDLLGLPLEFLFELEDLPIKVLDHGQVVFESDLAQGMVFGIEQRLFPEVARAAGLFGGNAVVRQLVGVDARSSSERRQ